MTIEAYLDALKVLLKKIEGNKRVSADVKLLGGVVGNLVLILENQENRLQALESGRALPPSIFMPGPGGSGL